MESRLQELETRITFQEEFLNKLDEALASQQQQLLSMQCQIELILEQLKVHQRELLDTPEPPPPHY